MTIAAIGVTYPAAGVIATRPATAPETNPSELGFPCTQETSIHAIAAAAAAVLVVTNASAARPFASTALPELNPNQPNQSRAAPRMDHGMLAGSMCVLAKTDTFPDHKRKCKCRKP